MKSILFATVILFSQFILASVGAQLSEKKFTLPNGRGEVSVIVREAQTHFGLPYTVEARVKCSADPKSTKGNFLNAVCDVKPASVKVSADGKSVVLKVRQTDSEAFNLATRSADPETLMKLEPSCVAEGSEMTISLENFCR